MSYDPKISYPIGGKNVQGGLPTAILNTLQFNAVTNQWEFVAAAGVAGLGDLEFLRDKELAGDLLTATNSRTSIGTNAVIIPASGKTFFFVTAGVAYHENALNAQSSTEIQNNTVRIDFLIIASDDAAGNEGGNRVDRTSVQGNSLVGNGVLEFRHEIIATATTNIILSMIQGWIQDT